MVIAPPFCRGDAHAHAFIDEGIPLGEARHTQPSCSGGRRYFVCCPSLLSAGRSRSLRPPGRGCPPMSSLEVCQGRGLHRGGRSGAGAPRRPSGSIGEDILQPQTVPRRRQPQRARGAHSHRHRAPPPTVGAGIVILTPTSRATTPKSAAATPTTRPTALRTASLDSGDLATSSSGNEQA